MVESLLTLKKVTESYIVSYLINTNQTLKATYNYYQGLLKTLKVRDKSKFLSILHNSSNHISDYAKKYNNTLLDIKKYIVNSFDYDLSNGITGGTNNALSN